MLVGEYKDDSPSTRSPRQVDQAPVLPYEILLVGVGRAYGG